MLGLMPVFIWETICIHVSGGEVAGGNAVTFHVLY